MYRSANNDDPIRGVHRDPSAAAKLRSYLLKHDETKACEYFGLSRMSIARAAAGLGLHAATLRAVRDGLRRAEDAGDL
jgi:hypothetical protein